MAVTYFESSLNITNQRFACPGESVSYSCSVVGEQLQWQVNDTTVVSFMSNASSGDGMTCHGQLCQVPCYIFSAVLDNIAGTDMTNREHPFCYSTLTITPGELSDDESMLMDCATTPMTLNVDCNVPSGENTFMSLPFEVAGKLI